MTHLINIAFSFESLVCLDLLELFDLQCLHAYKGVYDMVDSVGQSVVCDSWECLDVEFSKAIPGSVQQLKISPFYLRDCQVILCIYVIPWQ